MFLWDNENEIHVLVKESRTWSVEGGSNESTYGSRYEVIGDLVCL